MAAISERKLVGFDNFKRHNPLSDKFDVQRFHHIEFYTSDASNTAGRFTWGFGMHMVAKSDLSTGRYCEFCCACLS
jgi:4-hydroxyphenylpyruvate dioxygenase